MTVERTNILVAFANLVTTTQRQLTGDSSSHNRANQMGESLETYVKDLFCDSFNLNETEKLREHQRHFSYLGNQNNPPDIMLKGGDAIEVKKIESPRASLALNSSHPKDVLHMDDPRISNECKSCEVWTEKDIIYTIGCVKNSQIKYLWFVYGKCYSAPRDTYIRISEIISNGVNSIPDVEFESTNELARVNKVDPLGITYLRIRGMWGIDNPVIVYKYIPDTRDKFANLLMLSDKYNSFPEEDRQRLEMMTNHAFTITDIRIKDPNNPARLLDAKLLSYNI